MIKIKSENKSVFLATQICNKYLDWLNNHSLKSYDWYDIWGTDIGSFGKKLFLRNKYLGSLIVAPIMIVDIIYPKFRKFFVKNRSFPICHAHTGIGLLNLYKITNDTKFLNKAKSLVEPLLDMSSPLIKDLGWGMKHKWMTISGIIPQDTPCNTQTYYPYEFFLQMNKALRTNEYDKYLMQIARHVANDFYEWKNDDMLACSYSIMDKRKVVNANSYRALMLIDSGKRFNNEEYYEKGISTLKYIIHMQNKDGSWPYAEDQSFVDTYHTCFVLKNLLKIKNIIQKQEIDIDDAIEKGLNYYLKNLFDRKGLPIPYSVKPRFVLHKYDSYDFAESIALLAELDIKNDFITRILEFVKDSFQTKEGWFIFKKYPLIDIKGIPYLRYANSAMFLALTKVIIKG